MSIRKPFKLPGRESWYIDIDRKRRSLGTHDHAEALRIYTKVKEHYDAEVERRAQSERERVKRLVKVVQDIQSRAA